MVVSKLKIATHGFFGISKREPYRQQELRNYLDSRKKSDHVTDLLHKLHWFPKRQRITFKILFMVFKIFLDSCPVYLKECLTILDYENRVLKIKFFNKSYGERAFCNYAPKLWNALPENLRKSQTLIYFKKHLKH